MDDRVVTPAKAGRQPDPIVELLILLREKPNTEGIQAIVAVVKEEHGDYHNLGKVVRHIMNRALTEEEETLIPQLGTNA